jgi:hypothetical protein
MVKKIKLKDDNEKGELPPKEEESTSELKAIMKDVIKGQKDINDRMNDYEKKRSVEERALLQMVNFLYDTDDKHIAELTRIPVPSARPFALGMALETILDEDKKDIPLSRTVRINYMRLMRSVGGVHLGRGLRLAESQAEAAATEAEEMELGEE